MIAIRFGPDSISIQGPSGDVVTKNKVKCIATTTLPLTSMQLYDYNCNREEVTIWLPCIITNLRNFEAFTINISPAPRDDSESDYSRVEIGISDLLVKEPIISLLELFPISENEDERIIHDFKGTATWASNCDYLMYNPESLIYYTPIVRNMSGPYYNCRMNTTTIHDYDALINRINGSKIVEVCYGKLRIFSLEMGLLTLTLDEGSGNYKLPFEYVRKRNKFLGE